jgi:hypothetical protein
MLHLKEMETWERRMAIKNIKAVHQGISVRKIKE